MRDILYLTKGRREFTEHTFNLLADALSDLRPVGYLGAEMTGI